MVLWISKKNRSFKQDKKQSQVLKSVFRIAQDENNRKTEMLEQKQTPSAFWYFISPLSIKQFQSFQNAPSYFLL